MKKRKRVFAIFVMIFIFLITIILGIIFTKSTSLWYFEKMNINKVWTYSKGKGQIIAFIDTGISRNLEKNIEDKIVYKYNVLEDNMDVSDLHGHGTEMVSIISGDDKQNVLGISPDSNLIIIKAVSDDGKTDNSYLLKALEIAEKHKATVVNISLGGFKSDKDVSKQIEKMINKDITIVSSSGDYGNKDLLFPAVDPNVISVEACDENLKVCDFSNQSENSVALMPGNNIEALNIGDNGELIKGKFSGTSEACSITSGYIALIKSYFASKKETVDNSELKKILQETKQSNFDFIKPFSSEN